MVNDGDFLFDNSHKRMTGNHIKACQHGRPFLTTRSVFVSIAVRINPTSAFPYPATSVYLKNKNKNKNKNFIDPKQKYISSKVQPFRENQKQIKSIIVHVT